MTKVEYVDIVYENPPSNSNPAEIAKKLEEKINSIKSSSVYPLLFICSNFLGTKPMYSKFPPSSNNISNSHYATYEPDNTIYQFILFFDERYN